jgi:LysR family transcriptional regulator of gallate degradation
VVIGTTPLGRADFLPTAIATTIAQHPGLRVSTVESLYDALIGDLRSGDVDMVFGVLRPPELCQGLISEPLFTDRLSVVARADHSLSKRVNLEIADLIDERWILPRPVALARPVVEAAFRKLGLDPPVPAVESGDLSIVRQLLCTSDMLAVTSPNQLALELRTGTLVELPVTLGGTDRDVGLILREGAMLSPASLTVLEAVRRQSRLQNQRRLLAAS